MKPPLAAWPVHQLGPAISALAKASGMTVQPISFPADPFAGKEMDNDLLTGWIDTTADALGIEAEPVQVSYPEIDNLLRRAAPALFAFSLDGRSVYVLALLKRYRGGVVALGPDLRPHKLSYQEVVRLFAFKMEAGVAAEVDRLLANSGLTGSRADKARQKILNQRLKDQVLNLCWILRAPITSSFFQQIRNAGLMGNFFFFLATYALRYALFLFSWKIIGESALGMQLDGGRLLLWGLLLLSMVPFSMLTTWHQGAFNLGVAALLKRRLLLGAVRQDPDRLRGKGSGALLGRVLETDALETLVLNGGFTCLLAFFDLAAAVYVLAHGVSPITLMSALILFLLCWSVVSLRYYRAQRTWTYERLDITAHLIEQMVGHRTRLIQQDPKRYHDGEDEQLTAYFQTARNFDRMLVLMRAVSGRAWLILGLALLIPAIMAGAQGTSIAIALGGVMLAYKGLSGIAGSVAQLSTALVAWEQVGDLLEPRTLKAGSGEDRVGMLAETTQKGPLLQVRDVHFAYPGRGRPILNGVNLDIQQGDRILLEGGSGSGKSTLAAMLSGRRGPDRGLVLLQGFDRQTLGEQTWQTQIAAAPQFHENHIFTATLAFNLLMGGEWPAHEGLMEEAREICRELGLGPLLERMPAGINQLIGDTGWQLSHGERSRVFIARALLSKASLIILDESFASLDPQTFQQAMACVRKRAPGLMVIAHP